MKQLLCLMLIVASFFTASAQADSVTVPSLNYVNKKLDAMKMRIDSIVIALNGFNKMATTVTTASADAAAAKAAASTASTNVGALTTRVAAVEVRFDTTIRTWIVKPPLTLGYGGKAGTDTLGIILKQ